MHRLTDFKNFARAELDLFEPLTVLLGRNGSGKTNLIEGVELLATLARGTLLDEITDIDRGGVSTAATCSSPTVPTSAPRRRGVSITCSRARRTRSDA